MSADTPTLDVRELKTHFFTKVGVARAVDGVSFTVGKGEVVGLVGESGSGKSVTGFSIIGLVDPVRKATEGKAEVGEGVAAARALFERDGAGECGALAFAGDEPIGDPVDTGQPHGAGGGPGGSFL